MSACRRWSLFITTAMLICLALSSSVSAKSVINVWVRSLEPDFATVVEQFQKDNPDIEVAWATVPGRTIAEINQKILTSLATDTAPDVIGISIDFAMQSQVNGYFIDLTPQLSNKTGRYTFFQGLLDQGTAPDGRLICVPFWLSVPLVFWNGDMFAASGINPSQGADTWDDLRLLAKKLTKTDGNTVTQYGLAGLWASTLTWFPALWSAGGDVFDANGQALIRPGNEAAEWALGLWQEFHVTDRTVHLSWQSIFDGVSAMALTGMSLVPQYQKLNPVWPLYGAVIPRHINGEHKPYLGGDGWAIPRTSSAVDAAWRFIDYMSRPDIQREYMKAHGGSWINGASGIRESYTTDLFTTIPIWQQIALSLQSARLPQMAFMETGIDASLNKMLVNARNGANITQELQTFASLAEARWKEVVASR
jgi:multiple sugar transport system substrate-binding protein